MAMGGRHLSSGVIRADESTSLLDSCPVSVDSSPSPLLHGKAMRRLTTRRQVVKRFISSPFAAIFRMTFVRASTSDKQPNNDKARVAHGEERRGRPSLQELLTMEASSSRPERKRKQDVALYEVSCGSKESTIVVLGFPENAHMRCTGKEKQDPFSPSINHYTVSNNDQQTTMLPAMLGAGRHAVPGGNAMLSAMVQMNVKKLVVIFESLRESSRAMRIDMGQSKGLHWKLAGSHAPNKADLFYYRPIPMGRRCRVQHLEESPYK